MLGLVNHGVVSSGFTLGTIPHCKTIAGFFLIFHSTGQYSLDFKVNITNGRYIRKVMWKACAKIPKLRVFSKVLKNNLYKSFSDLHLSLYQWFSGLAPVASSHLTVKVIYPVCKPNKNKVLFEKCTHK